MNHITSVRRGTTVLGWTVLGCLAMHAASADAQAGPLLHGRIAVSSRGLDIHGALFYTAIPMSDLRVAEARIVDLDQEAGLRPMVKIVYAFSLPWIYHSGWFLLWDHQKAVVVFHARSNLAVYIPTTRGYAVLVGPNDPSGFLDALRRPTDVGQVFSIGTSR